MSTGFERREIELNEENLRTRKHYAAAHTTKCHQVPLIRATKKSMEGYAIPVYDFDSTEIDIVAWPVTGTRPLVEGTGKRGGLRIGDSSSFWEGEYIFGDSKAQHWESVLGRLALDSKPNDRKHVLVCEANYHPDGEQCFFPRDGNPYVAVLAKPGDDVKPSSFRAFYCDGTFGIKVLTGVWHQPMYPVTDKGAFRNKQGAIYACVKFNPVEEFGVYLSIPLKESLIEG